MPGPVIRMAPNPIRLTVRSPPTSMVPAAAAVGCSFTRYLLLVLTVSLSRPPLRAGAGEEHFAGHQRAEDGTAALSGLVALLLAAGFPCRGGRSGGYGHIGLEMLRQAGRRRLLKAPEALVDLDLLHVQCVDEMVGVD